MLSEREFDDLADAAIRVHREARGGGWVAGSAAAIARAGYETGVAAERARCARIAEDAPGSDATGYYASEAHAGYQEAQRHIAAAIRAGNREEVARG